MTRSFSPSLYFLGRFLTRHLFRGWFSLEVKGLEHLPSRGPAIICPKHQRWEDIPLLALALPPPLYYIAKVELFRYPLVRELLAAWGGVPLDRQQPRATLSSFKRLLPLLRDRAFLVLFPEGTYFKDRVGPGKHRFIQLLLKLQGENGLEPLPFVPVGLAYRPRGWGWEVAVRVAPPLRARDPEQAPALTAALMARIGALSS